MLRDVEVGLDTLAAQRLHDPGLGPLRDRLAVLAGCRGDARVVHEDVERAELALERDEHRPHLAAVRDVGLERAPAARVAHLLHGLLGGLEPHVVDHDARALVGEEMRDRAPDSRPAARDERDPTLELHAAPPRGVPRAYHATLTPAHRSG